MTARMALAVAAVASTMAALVAPSQEWLLPLRALWSPSTALLLIPVFALASWLFLAWLMPRPTVQGRVSEGCARPHVAPARAGGSPRGAR